MIVKFEKSIPVDSGQTTFCKYKSLHNLIHWHMEHEIILVSCGEVKLTVGSKVYTLTPGMSAFIKCEEIHCIEGSPDSVTQVIKTVSPALSHIVRGKILQSPILSDSSSTLQAFQEIENELKSLKEYKTIVADSIAIRLVAEIFRSEPLLPEEKSSPDVHNKLLQWIAQNYTDISFSDAVEFMGFSKSYFSKYFKELMGMSFTKYLNILKVSSAIDQIQNGETNMTNLSIRCGFGTIRNFNRVFKELTGHTPKHLPQNYTFSYTIVSGDNDGFDPTLSCSQIVE